MSTESKRAIKKITKNGLKWLVSPGHHEAFWSKLEAGLWEPELYLKMQDLIDSETIFLDIGGWIGPTTLFGAQLAKKTYAFEPNPYVFDELKTNLYLNHSEWTDRVEIINAGIGKADSVAWFGYANHHDDSTGSLLYAQRDQSIQVKLLDIAKFIQSLKPTGNRIFIKMDIEGSEFDLIPYLANYLKQDNFPICLSLHPQFLYQKLKLRYPGNNSMLRLARRINVSLAYRKIYESFGTRKIYTIDGREICKEKNFVNMALHALFPSEIVVP